MTIQEIADQKSAIKQVILDLVNASWADNQNALLIAKIGSILVKRFDLKKDLNGIGLTEFIEKEMVKDLTPISSPKDPLIKALVPHGVTLDTDISKHFKAQRIVHSRGEIAQATLKRVDINRRLWKAFSFELQDGLFRHIKLEPVIHFEDDSESNRVDYLTIDRALINPPLNGNKQERNSIIQKNILEWAEANGVPASIYLERPFAQSPTNDKNTVFDALINALTPTEYSRISIPLDIVLKLQQKNL